MEAVGRNDLSHTIVKVGHQLVAKLIHLFLSDMFHGVGNVYSGEDEVRLGREP